MDSFPKVVQKVFKIVILGCIASWCEVCPAQNNQPANEIRIVAFQGVVETCPAGATVWVSVQTNQSLHLLDRLRTGADSRVALLWSDQSVVSFGASTEIEILPPDSTGSQCGLHLIRGIISFFHRDKPGQIQIITRGTVAGVEGTEFVMAVDDTERTTLSVIDGKVKFGNELAALVLTNGQQAAADFGKAPARTAGFIANNLLQWCFYYPAVLDLNDLSLTTDEQKILGKSLDAYRAGDLQTALNKFPAQQSGSDAVKIYRAASLLSVGNVEDSEKILSSLSGNSERAQRLATALRELICAVKRQTFSPDPNPKLATEFLANSYYEQSLAIRGTSLETALTLAKQAATNSPSFGFAWERVAELEFSFSRTDKALDTLNKSLALAPRNAEALALKGFLLAAQNQTRDAMTWFDRALAADSALGNAWLGHGLCRIRLGDATGGREDLLVAAALEPQRAGLRSYLGKAYANSGDFARATKELQLAKKLDPNDPTAWLYSALLNQEKNQVNDAVRDLEKSEELNDNRSVYRSQLLLDQDRAVRDANLAAMYRDAGMFDVSVDEAARAENSDYANYSAHLFLANSYDQLLDPNEVNLRYETPAQSEYLLANLLAPAGAGTLSPAISQQEYSRLFERDGFGIASDTEYLGRGAWDESGAQFGVFGNSSYDFEAHYHSDPGQWANNDFEQRVVTLALKQQFTPADSIYAQVFDYNADGGDLHQYYNPSSASPDFHFNEMQEPTVVLGYHHEWSPGVHTLFLLARVADDYSFTNPAQPVFVTFKPDFTPGNPQLTGIQGITMNEEFENKLALYSGELQQIWETPAHNTILGTRTQFGDYETLNTQNLPSSIASAFPSPPTDAAQQNLSTHFYRASFYGYHQWQIADPLQLVGGLAYDWIEFPANAQTAPISGKEETASQLSPKAGLIWTPAENTTFRLAYTRSLAGANVDQSYQIEPSQVAGFVQSFRSIIPESATAASPGAQFETFGISLEQKFHTGTYLGLYGEILNSRVRRLDGAFDVLPDELDFAIPSGLHEDLNYYEKTFQFTANQLVGRDWSLGGQYRVSQAVLNDNFPTVPNGLIFTDFQPRQQTEALLQQLNFFAIYNHPSGFFAKGEALWNGQDNGGYTPDLPGDDFWQFNAFVGWRFLHRRAEVTFGLLNLTGQDYKLNPLNIYNELPRTRTFTVRLQINF